MASTTPPPSGNAGARGEWLSTTRPTPIPTVWNTVIATAIAGIQVFIPAIRVERAMKNPISAITGSPIAAMRIA